MNRPDKKEIPNKLVEPPKTLTAEEAQNLVVNSNLAMAGAMQSVAENLEEMKEILADMSVTLLNMSEISDKFALDKGIISQMDIEERDKDDAE